MNQPTPKEYAKMAQQASPATKSWKNIPLAFLVGGLICTIGQLFFNLYRYAGLEEQDARGAVSVTLIGLGALLTALGTVLPPLIVISIISVFYAAFRDNRIVSLVLKGMQAGVAAVIANVVITMVAGILKQRRALPICIMLGTFAASAVFSINVVLCILACAVIGLADTLIQTHKSAEGGKGA